MRHRGVLQLTGEALMVALRTLLPDLPEATLITVWCDPGANLIKVALESEGFKPVPEGCAPYFIHHILTAEELAQAASRLLVEATREEEEPA